MKEKKEHHRQDKEGIRKAHEITSNDTTKDIASVLSYTVFHKQVLTRTSPRITAHTNNKLAKMTMAPPKIPTAIVFGPDEKQGATHTPRKDVNPTIAVDPHHDSPIPSSMVYTGTKVMLLADRLANCRYASAVFSIVSCTCWQRVDRTHKTGTPTTGGGEGQGAIHLRFF
jgi:hypothetical protein